MSPRKNEPVDWYRELEDRARGVAHAMEAIHGVVHNVIVNHEASMVLVVQSWDREVRPR